MNRKLSIIFPAAAIVLCAVGLFLYMPRESPEKAVNQYILQLKSEKSPEGGADRLNRLIADSIKVSPGERRVRGRSGTQALTVSCIDKALASDKIRSLMPEKLSEIAGSASRAAQIYDESGAYLSAVLDTAFELAADELAAADAEFTVSRDISLALSYDGAWKVNDGGKGGIDFISADELAELYDQVSLAAGYISPDYSLPLGAVPGPVPDQANFHVSDDPSELLAVLQTPAAQRLINGQKLNWSENIPRLPGTPIRWYFDESLLVIVWQECTCQAVGTFQEVFIADGSQFRRKLAGDSFWGDSYTVPTELSRECNAVAAMSGDRFAHGERPFGIFSTYGETTLIHTSFGEVCYITGDGDMLFSYPEQFKTDQEVLDFISENNVSFSLGWGPVIIDNGVDVLPDAYLIGEINDFYARCCLGMLGKRHYLGLTVNCQSPGYNYLITLRQAADVMIDRGCYKAYTLDGGQTASIIFNGELINPVQFGFERPTSDIIYFATGLD